MCIFNKTTLENIFINQQSSVAFSKGILTQDEYESIKEKHPVQLYSPNIFVAIGLGLLTLITVFCTVGLLTLLWGAFFSVGILLILIGFFCYVAMEYMCRVKKHKNSGVDITLMCIIPVLMLTGITMKANGLMSDELTSLVLLLIFLWFTYRFANTPAAVAATITLFAFTFNLYNSMGEFTIYSFPFVLMAVAALVYILATKQLNQSQFYIYYSNIKFIRLVSLFGFYAFGNYFVVATFVHDYYLLTKHSALDFGWFFWLWTFVVPVLYLYYGLKKKDIILLRVGVLLVAASVITYRFYFHVIPIETALIIAGTLLIILSYYLMRILKSGKNGFIYTETTTTSSALEQVEAFAVSQIAAPTQTPNDETKFGGGDFGGAGSGSKY